MHIEDSIYESAATCSKQVTAQDATSASRAAEKQRCSRFDLNRAVSRLSLTLHAGLQQVISQMLETRRIS